jgi:hypothetical protein
MNERVCIKCVAFLSVLLATTGIVTGYDALQSESIQLEVKAPLQIMKYASELSLFPGETLQFKVDVENHASVSYNALLTFRLNDTKYQEEHVSFSRVIYTVNPGTNSLTAWLTVSNNAPAALLELTINITRNVETSPEPPPTGLLTPSATLFGAGARWAARNGTSALYINWLDNYYAHNGTSWGPYWGEGYLAAIKNTTIIALKREGFDVLCVGDVPDDLSRYDLVVFEAYYAVEPKHASLVRDYLKDGGSVVVTGGVPCYFSTYCKDMWPGATGGQDLTAFQDWFGAGHYINSGGLANLVTDAPLGTSLSTQVKFYYIDAYGAAGVIGLGNSTQAMAKWQDGTVFAFTNEYGDARVYYQVAVDW